MGVRYNKRIQIIKNLLYLNISKSGVSLSFGPKGAKVNVGSSGAGVNVGVPGTGVRYTKKMGKGQSKKARQQSWLTILLIAAIVLVGAGQAYESMAWLTWSGVGVAVLYFVLLYALPKSESEDTEKPSTRRRSGKKADATETIQTTEETMPQHVGEAFLQQLRDRLAHSSELTPLEPRLTDAAKVVVHEQRASMAVLADALHVNDDEAERLLRQLEVMGIVGMPHKDGSRSVVLRSDGQLREVLAVVFE